MSGQSSDYVKLFDYAKGRGEIKNFYTLLLVERIFEFTIITQKTTGSTINDIQDTLWHYYFLKTRPEISIYKNIVDSSYVN